MNELGGKGTIKEVSDWINTKYPNEWKDVGTELADMVPKSHGGNRSSTVNDEYRVLERVSRGRYQLFSKKSSV